MTEMAAGMTSWNGETTLVDGGNDCIDGSHVHSWGTCLCLLPVDWLSSETLAVESSHLWESAGSFLS